jgi:hypothetical protein
MKREGRLALRQSPPGRYYKAPFRSYSLPSHHTWPMRLPVQQLAAHDPGENIHQYKSIKQPQSGFYAAAARKPISLTNSEQFYRSDCLSPYIIRRPSGGCPAVELHFLRPSIFPNVVSHNVLRGLYPNAPPLPTIRSVAPLLQGVRPETVMSGPSKKQPMSHIASIPDIPSGEDGEIKAFRNTPKNKSAPANSPGPILNS